MGEADKSTITFRTSRAASWYRRIRMPRMAASGVIVGECRRSLAIWSVIGLPSAIRNSPVGFPCVKAPWTSTLGHGSSRRSAYSKVSSEPETRSVVTRHTGIRTAPSVALGINASNASCRYSLAQLAARFRSPSVGASEPRIVLMSRSEKAVIIFLDMAVSGYLHPHESESVRLNQLLLFCL